MMNIAMGLYRENPKAINLTLCGVGINSKMCLLNTYMKPNRVSINPLTSFVSSHRTRYTCGNGNSYPHTSINGHSH